jgi:hypothetical protein
MSRWSNLARAVSVCFQAARRVNLVGLGKLQVMRKTVTDELLFVMPVAPILLG